MYYGEVYSVSVYYGEVYSVDHSTRPSPKWATGSIPQRYPDPPSRTRECAPLPPVKAVTREPRAKAPARVRGITRSQ